jgi:protein-S-isoprenylcysteine O-methyltransferase Ste14
LSFLDLKLPPVAVLLLCAVPMWFVGKRLPSPGFKFYGQGALAVLVLAVGIAIGLAAIRVFRRNATTVNPMTPEKASQVVTTGVFGFTRNPMYLALALVLVAWTIFLGSLAAGLGVAAFVAYMTMFQIIPEERILASKFGARYDEYCRSVRRWI